MPRDAVTLAAVRSPTFAIVCEAYGRRGRYAVAQLAEYTRFDLFERRSERADERGRMLLIGRQEAQRRPGSPASAAEGGNRASPRLSAAP